MANRIKNGEINVYAVSLLRLDSVQNGRLAGIGCDGFAVTVSAMTHLQEVIDKSESVGEIWISPRIRMINCAMQPLRSCSA